MKLWLETEGVEVDHYVKCKRTASLERPDLFQSWYLGMSVRPMHVYSTYSVPTQTGFSLTSVRAGSGRQPGSSRRQDWG